MGVSQDARVYLARYGNHGMIGISEHMLLIYQLIEKAGPRNVPVLIHGETGTGKERVARALHSLYGNQRPFVAVNSSAIPEELLETELFGYKRGAFTGANADKEGRFVQAHGGILFLDEIGTMSPFHQSKLLRAIEHGEIEPLGSRKTEKVSTRVITATNINLEAAIYQGRFREDLYYRINMIVITLPPLRERVEDIEHLTKYRLLVLNGDYGLNIDITPDGIEFLKSRPWYGNIRQFENFLERAVIMYEPGTPFDGKYLESLPDTINMNRKLQENNIGIINVDALVAALPAGFVPGLNEALLGIKDQAIKIALGMTKGKKKQAAEMLGLTPRELSYFIRDIPKKIHS